MLDLRFPPSLPTLCTACASADALNLVPTDRGGGDDLVVRFHVLCPLCLDELLRVFPLRPRMFSRRETTGRLAQPLTMKTETLWP